MFFLFSLLTALWSPFIDFSFFLLISWNFDRPPWYPVEANIVLRVRPESTQIAAKESTYPIIINVAFQSGADTPNFESSVLCVSRSIFARTTYFEAISRSTEGFYYVSLDLQNSSRFRSTSFAEICVFFFCKLPLPYCDSRLFRTDFLQKSLLSLCTPRSRPRDGGGGTCDGVFRFALAARRDNWRVRCLRIMQTYRIYAFGTYELTDLVELLTIHCINQFFCGERRIRWLSVYSVRTTHWLKRVSGR